MRRTGSITGMTTALCLCSAALFAAPAPKLTKAEREELVRFARKTLRNEVRAVAVPTATGKIMIPAPEALVGVSVGLRRPRDEQIFIRIFRDRAPTIRFGSRRGSLIEATFAAMVKARTLPSFKFYGYDDAAEVGLLFERVTERHTVPPARWFAQLPFIDLGVHGVALTHGRRGGALPPGEVFLSGLDSRDAFIADLCKSLSLFPKWPKVRAPETELWDRKKTRVEILNFETFLSRGASYPVIDLYRMNDLTVRPWTDRLAVARRLAWKLLVHQAADGRFFHRYNVRRGEYTVEGYDIIDHAYAIVTLCELSSLTREKRFLQAAGRAVRYLKKQFRLGAPVGGKPFLYVVYDREASLGAAAMAIIALDRYARATGGVFHENDMKQLGRFLLMQQYDDGSFRHYYRYDPKVAMPFGASASAPGQATWALSVLERRARDRVARARWHKAARLSTDYLITKREKAMRWTAPPADAWFTAALHEMNAVFAEKPGLDYARRMADTVLTQQLAATAAPDMVGSFRDGRAGSVRGAAVRVRLLSQVDAFTVNTPERRRALLETCRRSMNFIRFNQLAPHNAFYVREPQKIYGMVRSSAFKNDVRLDTTCHVIQAILWLDRMEKRK